MPNPAPPVRIGVCGSDNPEPLPERGWRLWPVGYRGALAHAGAEPVLLELPRPDQTWDDLLQGVHGIVLAGDGGAAEEALCLWCRAHRRPLLAIDGGLHTLNGVYGGSLHLDLPRELPEALQHRHPPEPGQRHVIAVSPGTRVAAVYGDGEIIVNSEHRRAVQRVARGFRVSARALDGVVEAVESELEGWFAVGVQWHPASASASGLDIQLFRALIDACRVPARKSARKPRRTLTRAA
jgi:gamma-glutamyl-gamma-aminobutyrate hydrolase PuuD